MAQLTNEAFADERQANNELFKKVRFTREMGTDGDNLVLISEAAKKRSAQLAKSVAQYPAATVAKKLRTCYAADAATFDWTRLGEDVAACFRTVPALDFLCGPLNKPEKAKVQSQARKKKATNRDDGCGDETQYETRSGEAGGDDEQKDEATNLRLDKIVSVMEDEMTAAGFVAAAPTADPKAGLDVMKLLVNKDSFCETVENFFDLSFLVKDGRACVEIEPETGLPVTRLTDPPDEAVPKTQNVVVLSMADMASVSDLWDLGPTKLVRENDAE